MASITRSTSLTASFKSRLPLILPKIWFASASVILFFASSYQGSYGSHQDHAEGIIFDVYHRNLKSRLSGETCAIPFP
jgi:hypothetical protein